MERSGRKVAAAWWVILLLVAIPALSCHGQTTLDLAPNPDSDFSLPAVISTYSPGLFSKQAIFADDQPEDNNVYAPPAQPEGTNGGGVQFNVDFSYVNRYVYRGVDHDHLTPGNHLNLLLDGRLTFDFGKYPHPFVGIFSSIEDSDPISRFQEFRPQVGATWNLRPFLLEAGGTDYIYPQREQFNTSEAYFLLQLDDSWFFKTQEPIISPYMLTAYDYQLNNGWYLEWGMKHDFHIDPIGLMLTLETNFAYINAIHSQFDFVNQIQSTGLQHYEVGLIGTYSLNRLFHVGQRFGEFDVKGYLYYDCKLSTNITGNDVIWGGFGIGFTY